MGRPNLPSKHLEGFKRRQCLLLLEPALQVPTEQLQVSTEELLTKAFMEQVKAVIIVKLAYLIVTRYAEQSQIILQAIPLEVQTGDVFRPATFS